MKLLARLFTICLLLCGLAYGSYAFGKYVLSTKLFGQAVVPNNRSRLAVSGAPKVDESVTRQFDLHADKPKVEVDVLPAEDAGPGPDPGTLSSARRSSATASGKNATNSDNTPGANAGDAGQDNASSGDSDDKQRNISGPDGVNFWGDEEKTDKSRSRRRRRRRPQDSAATTAAATDTGAPARAESTDGGGASDSGDSGSAVPRPEGSASDSSAGGDSGEDRPVSHHHRERSHESREAHDSPVPKPEGESSHSGGSGGDSGSSPVPQPE